MSLGLWIHLRSQVPANRINRLRSIAVDLDASTFTATFSTGGPLVWTFDQVATFLASKGVTRTAADLSKSLDEERLHWVRSDGTPPPEGGWPADLAPGRGGRS